MTDQEYGCPNVDERRQAVALEPEELFEVAGGDGGEVVRAVVVGGAVDAPLLEVGAQLLDHREVLAGDVLRALEHHVLEEMGEAGAPRLLVLRADVVPLVDVHDRELAVDVQDDLQAVRQGVLLELDVWNLARARDLAGASCRRCGSGDGSRGERDRECREPEGGGELQGDGLFLGGHTYLLDGISL